MGLQLTVSTLAISRHTVLSFLFFILFFLFLFLLLFFPIYFYKLEANYNIVVVFAIHWHESAMDLHVFPIPIPPPTSLSAQSLWVFPVHQVRALVSCTQPGLVICFTLDNIYVSILFSQNIPPSPRHTVFSFFNYLIFTNESMRGGLVTQLQNPWSLSLTSYTISLSRYLLMQTHFMATKDSIWTITSQIKRLNLK